MEEIYVSAKTHENRDHSGSEGDVPCRFKWNPVFENGSLGA